MTQPTGFRFADLLGSKAWVLVALVTVLGLILRLRGFNLHWPNPDEGIYYSMVTWSDWGSFWTEYSENAHPPLFYVLLRTLSWFCDDIGALRGFALVFGCLGIPAMYLLGRECGGAHTGQDGGRRLATLTGLGTALLVAVSPGLILVSQVVRPYTLQVASLALGTAYLLRYLRRGDRRSLPFYAAFMLVAVLTHYSTLLVLGGITILLVGLLCARRLRGEQCRALVLWNLPPLLAVLALYFLHLRPSLVGSDLLKEAAIGWLSPYLIDGPGEAWTGLLGVLAQLCGLGFEGPASLLFLAGLGVAVTRFRRQALLVLLPAAVIGCALLASWLQKYPFGFSRHSSYQCVVLLPLMAYAVATGVTAGRAPAGIVALLLLALCLARLPITRVLGSKLNPQLQIREHLVKRSDLQAAIPNLKRVGETPGLVLMSHQSYYLLMPLYHRDRQHATWSEDRKVMHFRWGKRDVLVWQWWEFTADLDRVGEVDSLYSSIKRTDELMPEMGLAGNRKVVVPFGGWSGVTPSTLLDMDSSLPAEKRVVVQHAGIKGFHVLELDVPAYLASVEAELRKRKTGR